jgi:hypothetical protein
VADFKISKITDQDSNQVSITLGTSGSMMGQKRLLGDVGANAVGNGGWYRTNGLWKTFMLYALDRKTALGAADVRIDACMELATAPDDPDVDTFAIEVATLNSAAPSFSFENPWRYVRARVINAGPTVQVGFFEQGQG